MSLPPSDQCAHKDHNKNPVDCSFMVDPCSPYCECCLDPFSVHTNKMQARIDSLEAALGDAWRAARLGHRRLQTFEIEAPDVDSSYQGVLNWLTELDLLDDLS